jgi:nucleoside-diphosphate-sugar epimerase
MTTIAITGINSYFAKTLLPKLHADKEIKSIIGIDVTPWQGQENKVTFFQEDVRKREIYSILKDVDIVLHLAFVVEEIRDKKKTHEINVEGSKYLAVKKDLPGAFNIAADDYSTSRKIYELAGVKTKDGSIGFIRWVANITFFLGLGKMSQGWVSLGEYPIIVNNEKFKTATGWQPKYTTEEAFRDFLDSVK